MVKVPSPPGEKPSARSRVGASARAVQGRVPPALAALLAATAIIGLSWALINPALQAPDENAHAAYAQSLGTRFALPGDAKRQGFSTEQGVAASVSGADQAASQPATKMAWSPADEAAW